MKQKLNISEAARRVRLHPQTLRRWEKRGWITVSRDYLGHRVFTEQTIDAILKRATSLRENNHGD